MNTPALETRRLVLRAFTERDLDALFLILRDKEANRFLPWYPVESLEEAKAFYGGDTPPCMRCRRRMPMRYA